MDHLCGGRNERPCGRCRDAPHRYHPVWCVCLLLSQHKMRAIATVEWIPCCARQSAMARKRASLAFTGRAGVDTRALTCV
jgi:hypothetical protein